jgi:hypothetical protein
MQVAFREGQRVRIATEGSVAEVRGPKGVLVARVTADRALEFDPDAGAPASARLTGVVSKEQSKYFLTDQTTHVKVELRGTNLESSVGKVIEVTGEAIEETPAAGATSVVRVTQLKVVGAAAKAAGAAGATAPAGVSTGVSASTIAIVGGVAAAGATVGGLYATGVIGGDEKPVSR